MRLTPTMWQKWPDRGFGKYLRVDSVLLWKVVLERSDWYMYSSVPEQVFGSWVASLLLDWELRPVSVIWFWEHYGTYHCHISPSLFDACVFCKPRVRTPPEKSQSVVFVRVNTRQRADKHRHVSPQSVSPFSYESTFRYWEAMSTPTRTLCKRILTSRAWPSWARSHRSCCPGRLVYPHVITSPKIHHT